MYIWFFSFHSTVCRLPFTPMHLFCCTSVFPPYIHIHIHQNTFSHTTYHVVQSANFIVIHELFVVVCLAFAFALLFCLLNVKNAEMCLKAPCNSSSFILSSTLSFFFSLSHSLCMLLLRYSDKGFKFQERKVQIRILWEKHFAWYISQRFLLLFMLLLFKQNFPIFFSCRAYNILLIQRRWTWKKNRSKSKIINECEKWFEMMKGLKIFCIYFLQSFSLMWVLKE